ncbi:hypothetical protein KI387_002031, partial [Taxus chinensis]
MGLASDGEWKEWLKHDFDTYCKEYRALSREAQARLSLKGFCDLRWRRSGSQRRITPVDVFFDELTQEANVKVESPAFPPTRTFHAKPLGQEEEEVKEKEPLDGNKKGKGSLLIEKVSLSSNVCMHSEVTEKGIMEEELKEEGWFDLQLCMENSLRYVNPHKFSPFMLSLSKWGHGQFVQRSNLLDWVSNFMSTNGNTEFYMTSTSMGKHDLALRDPKERKKGFSLSPNDDLQIERFMAATKGKHFDLLYHHPLPSSYHIHHKYYANNKDKVKGVFKASVDHWQGNQHPIIFSPKESKSSKGVTPRYVAWKKGERLHNVHDEAAIKVENFLFFRFVPINYDAYSVVAFSWDYGKHNFSEELGKAWGSWTVKGLHPGRSFFMFQAFTCRQENDLLQQ